MHVSYDADMIYTYTAFCQSVGELGGGGELLQELSDKEEGQQQLQKAVKGGGKKKGGKDAISMEPAVTGKLK